MNSESPQETLITDSSSSVECAFQVRRSNSLNNVLLGNINILNKYTCYRTDCQKRILNTNTLVISRFLT